MITLPTANQIINCVRMGWYYLGEGLFCKDEMLGYFTTDRGFYNEHV